MRFWKLRSYFAGVLTAVMIGGLCVPSLAATVQRQLTATYKDIRIVVNGQQITPQDINGNVVEPFVNNGTTYLPIRAVGEALGYDVSWDSITNTVTLSGGTSADWATTQGTFDLIFYHDMQIFVGTLQNTLDCINLMLSSLSYSISDYYYYQDLVESYFEMISDWMISLFSNNNNSGTNVAAYSEASSQIVSELETLQTLVETYEATYSESTLEQYYIAFVHVTDAINALSLDAANDFYAVAASMLS